MLPQMTQFDSNKNPHYKINFKKSNEELNRIPRDNAVK